MAQLESSFATRIKGFRKTYNIGTIRNTGINVNAVGAGRTLLALASRNTNTGNSTDSAMYLIRCGYSGDNYSVIYIGGSFDFVTWSLVASELHAVAQPGNAHMMIMDSKEIL